MRTRFPLIIGNWKMHKSIAEAKSHVQQLKAQLFRSDVGVWLAVPYTMLAAASESARGSNVQVGAQNMSDLMGGALTGEVSAPMIIETGASFVILGHSERRRIFFEDDFMINRKVKIALRTGLHVILCVGETKEEYESGQTETVLKKQLFECLEGVSASFINDITVAYEPVWAIGSNNPAKPEIVEKIHDLCKNSLASFWGLLPEDKASLKILYGGSVTPSNARLFLVLPPVAGLLVGGASLDVQAFAEIIHQAEEIR